MHARNIWALFTQYLMWRVLTGLQQCVTLSFMMVGHTKFAPDWCFGLVKRRLRRERVSCLSDVAAAVEVSAEANTAVLVGSEDGTPYVPVYNWSAFLAPHFRKVPGLKQYHHLTIRCEASGTVLLKMTADCGEEKLPLLRDGWVPCARDLPAVIPPPGLSRERQQYLHDHIRDYCTEVTKDIVCPSPQTSCSGDGVDRGMYVAVKETYKVIAYSFFFRNTDRPTFQEGQTHLSVLLLNDWLFSEPPHLQEIHFL